MSESPTQQSLRAAVQLHNAGQVAEAEKIYREILVRDPRNVEALYLLGTLAGQIGRLDAALELLRRAIQIKPDFAEAHNNIGNALRGIGKLDLAIAAFREAIRLNPAYAEAFTNLGNALGETGRPAGAIEAYRHGVALRPGFPDVHSNLILAMHYLPQNDTRKIADELRIWNARHAEPLSKTVRPHENNRDPNRRLRVGFVSPDFRAHTVGWNLMPLFRERDRHELEIFCYSHTMREDALTGQIRRHVDQWRNIMGISDSDAAEMIRNDRIDILVDLAAHSADNRLMIFARKPAPVQVTYLAYCSSTGLASMDFRLSDPFMDPEGADESNYSEKTIRLPHTYWCYSPGGPMPEPSRPPVEAAGHITFGCLNNFAKVSPALDLWPEILQQVDKSRLIVHSPPGSHLDSIRQRFAAKGISPDRLEFPARQAWADYVKTYQRIDIGLDPFPWGGGITTCDALWMGVPVVSMVGQTAVGRGGASILNNIGMKELIARTPAEYVEIAAGPAKDLPRLADLRSNLRNRMQQSPLMDAPRFARDVESALRQAWRQWCNRTPGG